MTKQQNLLHDFLEEWKEGDGITAHTSGSTGKPKKIVLPMAQVLRSAVRSNKFFGITRKSRLHAAMSFEFIGGKMMIARSLKAGCTLTFSEPSVQLPPPEGDMPVSLLSLVPAQMHHVVNNLEQFQNVEKYLIGGSAINDRLWDRIVSSGVDAWESYGMTETATHIAMRRISGPSSSRPRFVPLPGISIATGLDGCMHITDGDVKVETTDLVKIHEDGSFEILGRKDDVIISGGLKILPQEIETKIQPYITHLTHSYYISSVPDEIWTSKLVLLAVPDSRGAESAEFESELRKAIDSIPEEVLPKRMRPKSVRIIDALPLTAMGKLNRKAKI